MRTPNACVVKSIDGLWTPQPLLCDTQDLINIPPEIKLMRFIASLTAIALSLALNVGIASEPSNTRSDADQLLSQFGLETVQPIQKKTAASVRGEGGVAQTSGFSFVSGILVDPNTTSNIFGLDANSAFSLLTLDDPIRPADPIHQHQSQLELELIVDSYFSNILGGAGGAAAAYFR